MNLFLFNNFLILPETAYNKSARNIKFLNTFKTGIQLNVIFIISFTAVSKIIVSCFLLQCELRFVVGKFLDISYFHSLFKFEIAISFEILYSNIFFIVILLKRIGFLLNQLFLNRYTFFSKKDS